MKKLKRVEWFVSYRFVSLDGSFSGEGNSEIIEILGRYEKPSMNFTKIQKFSNLLKSKNNYKSIIIMYYSLMNEKVVRAKS